MTPTTGRRRRALCLGPLLGAFLLAGCTPASQAGLARGVAAARQAKDAEAETLKAAVCAMSIGAYHRVNSDAERRALDVLCDGSAARPLTLDDLDALRVLRDLGDGQHNGQLNGS